jgi:hypothetical protein
MPAEKFTTFPGKCFRFVLAPNGRARHCPNPAIRTGQFTDARGAVWTVDACAEHAEEACFRAGVADVKVRSYKAAPEARTEQNPSYLAAGQTDPVAREGLTER